MNISKLEAVLSAKKDLTKSVLTAKKAIPQTLDKSLVNRKTTEAILTAEKHVAEMPKGLNLEYFTQNYHKLGK